MTETEMAHYKALYEESQIAIEALRKTNEELNRLNESLLNQTKLLQSDANHDYKRLYEEALLTIQAAKAYYKQLHMPLDKISNSAAGVINSMSHLQREITKIRNSEQEYQNLFNSHAWLDKTPLESYKPFVFDKMKCRCTYDNNPCDYCRLHENERKTYRCAKSMEKSRMRFMLEADHHNSVANMAIDHSVHYD